MTLMSHTTAALKAIPQNQFQNCFQEWTRRWQLCIASQGEYCNENQILRFEICIETDYEIVNGIN
jgi:hypothetical protein